MCCCCTPDAAPLTKVGGLILRRLIAFVGILRSNAFAIGQHEAIDAARLLAGELGRRPATVRPALKALFCARAGDWRKFDELFDAHWRGHSVNGLIKVQSNAAAGSRTVHELMQGMGLSGGPGLDEAERVPDGSTALDSDGLGRAEGASFAASLAATDFRKLNEPHALAMAHELAERLARSMRVRLTRREHLSHKGSVINLRRTIRRSIGHGGEPIDLVRRRPKTKPLRLIMLLDASGSMSLYTNVFIRFIHGMLGASRHAEAFLFHTRLVHVSPAMREKTGIKALERLSLLSTGVGGGTRIGECFATFNRWHAKRTLGSRSCVIIVSDGYDTGEPSRLRKEMRAIAKRCRRIVWLNPMLGWEGYQPAARGMKAALPYVDLFAPAHSLDSLAKLEPYLAHL
jgi:uncharacterized protein with von Willebrand factor type A (vWA) domain